jgi:hypothetical protein
MKESNVLNSAVGEIVLQVGAEGGCITLAVRRKAEETVYGLAIVDQTLEWIGEGDEISGSRGKAKTWRGALKLLDRYPWAHLYPLAVHPDFAAKVLQAVKRRLGKEGDQYKWSRWRDLPSRR